MSGHEDFSRVDKVRSSSDRAFGFVFAAVFAIIAGWPLLDAGPIRLWALAIAVAFLMTALIRPATLSPLNRLWTAFGLLLHRIVSPIILGVMFFVVVTPMGVLMRVLRKDPLKLKWQPDAKSYWIAKEPPGPAPESMKHQF